MGISLNSFLGKLYFTTLNYQHFFNPPPKLKKVSIDPLILSYCTTVTPCGQNRVIIDKIVYHVTRMWSRTHQNTLYQFDFSLNPEMPLAPLNKIWNPHYFNNNKIAPQSEILKTSFFTRAWMRKKFLDNSNILSLFHIVNFREGSTEKQRE